MIPEPIVAASQLAVRALLLTPSLIVQRLVAGVGIGPHEESDAASLGLRIYLAEPDPDGTVPSTLSRMTLGAPYITVLTGPFHFLGGAIPNVAAPGARIALDDDPLTFGTLGAVVRDSQGTKYLLSCAHVLNGDGKVIFESPDGQSQEIAEKPKLISFDQQPIPADAGIARLNGRVLSAFPGLISAAPVDFAIGNSIRHRGAVTCARDLIHDVHATISIPTDGGGRPGFSPTSP